MSKRLDKLTAFSSLDSALFEQITNFFRSNPTFYEEQQPSMITSDSDDVRIELNFDKTPIAFF